MNPFRVLPIVILNLFQDLRLVSQNKPIEMLK